MNRDSRTRKKEVGKLLGGDLKGKIRKKTRTSRIDPREQETRKKRSNQQMEQGWTWVKNVQRAGVGGIFKTGGECRGTRLG